VLASPLLARIYTVEAFGALSIFTSYAALLAIFATGRYEFAIVIPDKEEKAIQLVRLIISIALFISLFYFVIIWILKEFFPNIGPTNFIHTDFIYWIPLYILFIATTTAFGYLLLRRKKYKLYSIATATQAITVVVVSITLGLFNVKNGLIIALVSGSAVFILLFFVKETTTTVKGLMLSGNMSKVAKEYRSFPQYRTFSDLALTASQQFAPILLSMLYSTTIVGFYTMANRMLRLPNIIVTNAIASVFRNEAIEEFKLKGECRNLYLGTFKKLLWLALPTYLILFICSPPLFQFFFGEQWLTAGHYAQIIITFLFFEFLANPFNELFTLRNKQRRYMIIQVLNVSLGATMMILGMFFFKDASWSLILFSANSIVFNLILLINSFRIANNSQ